MGPAATPAPVLSGAARHVRRQVVPAFGRRRRDLHQNNGGLRTTSLAAAAGIVCGRYNCPHALPRAPARPPARYRQRCRGLPSKHRRRTGRENNAAGSGDVGTAGGRGAVRSVVDDTLETLVAVTNRRLSRVWRD
jgi:hypothetical protein